MGGARRRITLQFGQQRLALALGTAQHGIDQALGRGLLQLVDAADRFADRRVGGDACVEQLIQADQQQRLEVLIARLERLLQ
ncbi:hypothetical protein D3C78_1633240 [compost metagenome]